MNTTVTDPDSRESEAVAEISIEQKETEGLSQGQIVRRRFFRHRGALIGRNPAHALPLRAKVVQAAGHERSQARLPRALGEVRFGDYTGQPGIGQEVIPDCYRGRIQQHRGTVRPAWMIELPLHRHAGAGAAHRRAFDKDPARISSNRCLCG